MIKGRIEKSTAQSNLEKCDIVEHQWSILCKNIYLTTIDPYMREFQFRIIHNYLPVNTMLYKWKITDSDKCIHCLIEKETQRHLFVECPRSITVYRLIQEWCNQINIILPRLCVTEVLYNCTLRNIKDRLIDHIILIYKYIIYFNKECSVTGLLRRP